MNKLMCRCVLCGAAVISLSSFSFALDYSSILGDSGSGSDITDLLNSRNASSSSSSSSDVSESMSSDIGSGASSGTGSMTGSSPAAVLPADSASLISITPQLAMSTKDYPVTAGDIYTLAFAAGSSAVTYKISVDSSYRIRVANLAVVDASGKTFPELKQLVESIVIRNYPMSGVQFVLAIPAVFKVTLKGEVKQTSVKQASALTRIAAVIRTVVTPYSSVRNVTVVSADGKSHTYDLFKAERDGDLTQNPYVRPDDVITIGRISRKVTLKGAVERPGRYELLDGENYSALITDYGSGFSEYADKSRVEINRLEAGTTKTHQLYVTEDALKSDFALANDDTITVSTIYDLLPVMYFEGAVQAPVENNTDPVLGGTQKIGSTTASSMDTSSRVPVRFSPGTDYAFFVRTNRKMLGSSADLSSAYIKRNGTQIPLNVTRILYDASYTQNEQVQAGDTLVIPFKQYFVTVSGAVTVPGRYPYIPDRGWDYYVGLAGGFDRSQNAFDAMVITDINGKRHSKSEPITPETNIIAESNSFTYFFNKYAPVITTTLTAVSTMMTVLIYAKTYAQ